MLHYDKLLFCKDVISLAEKKPETAERFVFAFCFSGCLSSVGNEQGVPSRPFSVTASSQLDLSHRPDDSFLYGLSSWCSDPTASSPQYLQFDFRKVVTVSGIASQGDAVDDKWVTKYAVRYGYDERSWLDYDGGQVKCHIKDSLITYVNMYMQIM